MWALGTSATDSAHAQQAKPAETIGATGPLADSLRVYVKGMVALLRERNVDAAIRLYGDTTRFVHIENGVMIPWSQLAHMMRTYLRAAPSNPLGLVGEPGVVVIDRNAVVVCAEHHFDDTPEAPANDGVDRSPPTRRERLDGRAFAQL